MIFQPLDKNKALAINPFYKGSYSTGPYLEPETNISIPIESHEQELAILAAYDYGIDALSQDGRYQLDRLLANLKVAITGR